MIFQKSRYNAQSHPYRSTQDTDIATVLNDYGIPFFYKEPTLVIENGKRCIQYSDFFLPTYNGLAIDYIIESKSGIFRRKKNVYQDNGIPYVQVSHRDMARPHWQDNLYHRIHQEYRKLPYRSRSYAQR